VTAAVTCTNRYNETRNRLTNRLMFISSPSALCMSKPSPTILCFAVLLSLIASANAIDCWLGSSDATPEDTSATWDVAAQVKTDCAATVATADSCFYKAPSHWTRRRDTAPFKYETSCQGRPNAFLYMSSNGLVTVVIAFPPLNPF